jgi:deaminated glutathione amidase
MTSSSNDSNKNSTTRRKALLAGAGLAATGVLSGPESKPAVAQDLAPFYPPVKPGIEPQGKKVEPYTAACVQSGAVPTFDSSGNALPDALTANLDRFRSLIKRGADEYGARFMSFPEFGLQIPSIALSPAQWVPGAIMADGPEVERIGKAAQDANAFVAFNAIEKIEKFPGRYFLAGMIVGPSGDLVLNYRKMTSVTSKSRPGDLLSAWLDHFGEDSLFPVVDTEIGRLACVIAADMYVPEVMRGMVLNGAEVISNPTAGGMLPDDNNFDIPTVTTMARRVRAYENIAYVLMSNLGPVGADPKPPFGRRQPSQIIDFKGNMLAATQTGGEEFAVATVDIDALRRARTSLGSLNTLAALQVPLYRRNYEAAKFAPVDTHVDAPLSSTEEHNDIMRETISELVERGILIPPGV